MADPGPGGALDSDEFNRNPELDQAMLARLRPDIRPRQDWAAGLEPQAAISAEEDVRFLLVHHTATDNQYERDGVIDQVREFYALHTGPERGWPDIAYNFLIDRFGGIWEARAGSLAGPVQGDATGGSQGFAQLASLIGNHHQVPPTPEAREALLSLLAWLAHRDRIDSTVGSTVEFVSRGSNRWPLGAAVTARTVSGHRDMSDTVCPGDFAYSMLDRSFPEAITARRVAAYGDVAPPILAAQEAAATNSNPATETPAAAAAENDSFEALRSESVEVEASNADQSAASPTGDSPDLEQLTVPLAATAALGAVAALLALRRRRPG